MARTVTIAMPDGTSRVIKGVPDDVTDAQLGAKIKASNKITAPATESTFEKGLIGLGSGFTRAGQGVKQLGLQFGEVLGLADEGSAADYTSQVKRERKFFANTPVGQSTPAKVGQVVGEALPYLAIPGGAVGGTATRIATGAAAGSAAAGLQFTEDQELLSGERFRNIAGGLLFGAAFPAVTSAVSGGYGVLRNTVNELTEKGAQRQVRQLVSKADLDTAVSKVADELGTWLTPAEATGRVDLRAFEQGLSVRAGSEAATELASRLRDRTVKISDSLEDVLNSVSQKNPQAAKLIKQGYKALEDTRISPEYFNKKIFTNPIIKKEWQKFNRSPDWKAQLQGVPRTSAKTLDEFKRYLTEREGTLFRANKKKAAENLATFRKGLVNDLDAAVPEYGVARGMSQLNIIHDKLSQAAAKSTAKVRGDDGVFTTDALELFRRTFKSDEQYEDLMRGLTKLPDAQKKLTKLRQIMFALEDSPINKAFSTQMEKGFEASGTGGLGAAGAATQGLAKTAKGKNLASMTLFITDPRYKASLLDDLDPSVFRKSTPAAMEALSKLSARMAAITTTPEAGEEQQ